MLKLQFVFICLSSFLLSSCGGGGGSGGSDEDIISFIELDTSPLRIIGFSDDSVSNTLYPIVDMGTIPDGKTVLLRVRDIYGMGDYYSMEVSNGFGGASAGTPAPIAGEPDNNPMDATVLVFGNYSDHGLEPVLDEDWFSFTASSGEATHYASTTSNLSGTGADPILEVYDPVPNLGPITYTQNSSNILDQTNVRGVYDPVNGLTLVGMTRLNAFDQLDKNFFVLVFSSPTEPGDYSIRYAAPPIPEDMPGSVTGSIHIDQYDETGGRITGSFDLTIIDVSRTSTIQGNFNVSRGKDEPGLLTGFKPGTSRVIASKLQIGLKDATHYFRGE